MFERLSRLLRSCSGKDGKANILADNENFKEVSNFTESRESSLPKSSLKRTASETDSEGGEDFGFWSSATLPVLQTMVRRAGYSGSEEERTLRFYQQCVIPSLGRRSTSDARCGSWRSFMTDDFSPMEFSWNWGLATILERPKIRYSVEPIGHSAGQAADPWNMDATIQSMRRFEKELPGCDCSTFNALIPRLANICDQATAPQISDQEKASPSSMFMAFDLGEGSPTIKAYMLPFNHLVSKEKSCGQMIKDFLLPYANETKWDSLIKLLDFGVTSDQEFGLTPFMIAFDCVPLAQNRMKIYFRSADTSFASVVRNLSVHNDRLSQGRALQDLRDLWHALFGLDPAPDAAATTPLRHTTHETAGILYYYEVRPRSPDVTAKVYLPAKHYGVDDLHTTRALAAFFRPKQRPGDRWVDEYVAMVESICGHRDLRAGSGLHTYVTCSVKGGSLDCTSYFNPELFHPARQWGRMGG